MNRLIFALIVTVLAAQPCFAEEQASAGSSLDPILVTVHGDPALASDIPGGVGVVRSEEISEHQPASLSNSFTFVPGVKKSSDSLWGSDINIRGLSRDAVVFVIDGARVNTANDLNGQYGLIDPNMIERIEVLKGPISALYGSGTIGGVVNIITKGGHFSETPEWQSDVSASGATNSPGYSTFGSTSYNAPDWYLYASQTFRDYGSFEDGHGTEMRNSQFRDYNTSVKAGLKENEENTTEAQFQYAEGRDIGIPGTGTAPLPPFADVTYPTLHRSLINVSHSWQPQEFLLKQSKLNLYSQVIERNARVDHFPEVSPIVEIDPEADHRTYGVKWDNLFEFDSHSLNGGLDVWQRRLDSSRERLLRTGMIVTDTPLPTAKFTSAGLFLEDSWKALDGLTVNGGARYDGIYVSNHATEIYKEDDVDDHSWNAHLGGSLDLSEHWRTRAIAARGYRAASLEERFTFLDLGGGRVKLGDPNLDPEDSFFVEWALQWLGDSFSATSSAFYNRLNNLIANRVVDERTIVNANIKEGRIAGTEFEFKWLLDSSWQLYGNLAWARGWDPENNEALPNIPPLNGAGGLRYENQAGWWGYLEVPFASRQNLPPPGVPESAQWMTVNMRAGYNFDCNGFNQRVFGGVDNIFDTRYRDYLTASRGFVFNEPGVSFVAGYEAKF